MQKPPQFRIVIGLMLPQELVIQRMNHEMYNARKWTPRGYLA